ncbi:MAG: hypothetical protein O9262_12015, partial [Cyclobacteriaceae bacterium]|nr:hypothetical protein [Cyclobacteriaceae bacterium]
MLNPLLQINIGELYIKTSKDFSMTQLTIKRLKEWSNRRFAYKILFDGQEQFELANGQERLIALDQPMTVQAKIMWGSSKKIKVDVNDNTIKEIRIKANKDSSIRLPFTILSIIILCTVVNLLYPDHGIKDFMIGLLLGAMVPLIGL